MLAPINELLPFCKLFYTQNKRPPWLFLSLQHGSNKKPLNNLCLFPFNYHLSLIQGEFPCD
jgi:hypothetical protein